MTPPERDGRGIVNATGQPVTERAERLVRQRVNLLEPAKPGVTVRPAQRRARPPQGPDQACSQAKDTGRVQPCRHPGPESEQADHEKCAKHGEAWPESRPCGLEPGRRTRQSNPPAKLPAAVRVRMDHGRSPASQPHHAREPGPSTTAASSPRPCAWPARSAVSPPPSGRRPPGPQPPSGASCSPKPSRRSRLRRW